MEGCRKRAQKNEGRLCGCSIKFLLELIQCFERNALPFPSVRKRVRIVCIIDLHSRRTFNANIWSILDQKFHVYRNIKQPYLTLNTVLYLVSTFRESNNRRVV